MTKLMFLCSGNTCRSPMAEGLARTIFGPGHSLASAGAETAGGLPVAEHAVTAMKELEIDISSHQATQLDPSTLEAFDTIIVFRPSAAESVTFPDTVNMEFIDVPDLYGGDLEKYRTAAYRIRSAVRELYVKDVLRRLASSDPPKGSHLEGVYGRAASEFEKELHAYVKGFVDPEVLPKATLGTIATTLHDSNNESHKRLASLARVANNPWVSFKHKDDPHPSQLQAGLHAMVDAYRLLSDDPD